MEDYIPEAVAQPARLREGGRDTKVDSDGELHGRAGKRIHWLLHSHVERLREEAMRAATRIACFMLRGSAWFWPAISNAVP